MFNSKRVQELLEISDEMKTNNLRNLNLTSKDMRDSVNIIMEWFQKQPHLQDIKLDTRRVENIYIGSKGSIERTKTSLDMYYTLKTAVPDIFDNRDPLHPEIRKANEGIQMGYTPFLTEDNYRIVFSKFLDPEKFNGHNFLKRAFMIYELKMIYDQGNNMIGIFDLSGLTMSHLLQITPFYIKLVVKSFQEAQVSRVKGIHFIKPPMYADAAIELVRSVLSPKLRSRVFIHKTMDDLHKVIDKKYLPKDFKGDLRTIKEIQDDWSQALVEHREWFLEEDKYKSDESRRPGKPVINELMGVHGSFRKLDVD